MKHVKLFEAFLEEAKETQISEALTSKSPEETVTVEVDMAWDDTDAEEDKAAKEAFEKFNITVEPVDSSSQAGTYEVTGKKKDILAYLQSEFYEMDDETVEEYYPELLN